MPRTAAEESEFQQLGKQLGVLPELPQPESYGTLGYTGRTLANVLPGALEKTIQPMQALLGMSERSQIPNIADIRPPQSMTESVIGGVGQIAQYLPAMIATEGAAGVGLRALGASANVAKVGAGALGWGLPMANEGPEQVGVQGATGALQEAARLPGVGWRGKLAAGLIGGAAGYYEGSKGDESPGISTQGAVMGGLNLIAPTIIDPLVHKIFGPNKVAAAAGKQAENVPPPHQPQGIPFAVGPHDPPEIAGLQIAPQQQPAQPNGIPFFQVPEQNSLHLQGQQPIIGQPAQPQTGLQPSLGIQRSLSNREVGLPIDPTNGANIYGSGNQYDVFAEVQPRPILSQGETFPSNGVYGNLGRLHANENITGILGKGPDFTYGRQLDVPDAFAGLQRLPSQEALSPIEPAAKNQFELNKISAPAAVEQQLAPKPAGKQPHEKIPSGLQKILTSDVGWTPPGTPLNEGFTKDAFNLGKKLTTAKHIQWAQKASKAYEGEGLRLIQSATSPEEIDKAMEMVSRHQYFNEAVEYAQGMPDKVEIFKAHDPNYKPSVPSAPKQSPLDQLAALQKDAEPSHIYHVTSNSNWSKIDKQGLKPMQTSNWVKSGSKKRYGKGEIYAFENFDDAVRWTAKMDWIKNSTFGSGDFSIVKLKRTGEWTVDDSDILGTSGSKGKWLKQMAHIPRDQIVDRIHFDKSLADRMRESEIKETPPNPPQPEGPATALAANANYSDLLNEEINHHKQVAKDSGYDFSHADAISQVWLKADTDIDYFADKTTPEYKQNPKAAKQMVKDSKALLKESGAWLQNNGYLDNKGYPNSKFHQLGKEEKSIKATDQVQIKGRFGPEIANVISRKGNTLHVEIDDPIFGKRQTSVLESDTTPVASVQPVKTESSTVPFQGIQSKALTGKEGVHGIPFAGENEGDMRGMPEDQHNSLFIDKSGNIKGTLRYYAHLDIAKEILGKQSQKLGVGEIFDKVKRKGYIRGSVKDDTLYINSDKLTNSQRKVIKQIAEDRKLKVELETVNHNIELGRTSLLFDFRGSMMEGGGLRNLKGKDRNTLTLEEGLKKLPAEPAAIIADIVARLQKASGQSVDVSLGDMPGLVGQVDESSGNIKLNFTTIKNLVDNWDNLSSSIQTSALLQIAGNLSHEIIHVVQLFGEKSKLSIDGVPLLKAIMQHVEALSGEQKHYIIQQISEAKGKTNKIVSAYLSGDVEEVMRQYKMLRKDISVTKAKELAAGEFMAEIGSVELLKRMEVKGLPSILRVAINKFKTVLVNVLKFFKEKLGMVSENDPLAALQKISSRMLDHFAAADVSQLEEKFLGSEKWASRFEPEPMEMKVQNNLLLKQQLARLGIRAAIGGTAGGIIGPQVGPNQISIAEGVLIGGIAGVFGPAVTKRLLSGNFPKEIAEAFTKSKGNPIKTFAAIMGHDSLRDMGLAARYGWTGEASGMAKLVRAVEIHFNLNKDTLLTAIEEKGRGMGTLLTGLMQDAMDKIRWYKPNASVEDATLQYFTGKLSKEQYMGLMTSPELQTYGQAAVTARESMTTLTQMFAAGMSPSKFRDHLISTSENYLGRFYSAYKKGKFNMDAFERAKADLMDKYKGQYTEQMADDILREHMREVQANRSLFGGRRGNSGQKIDSSLTFHRLATEEEIEGQKVVVGGLEHDPHSPEYKAQKAKLDWMESHKITDNWRDWLGEYKNPMERMIYTFQKVHPSAISAKIFSLLDERENSNGLRFSYTPTELNSARGLLKEGLNKATDPKEIARLQNQLKELSGYGALPQGSAYGKLAGKWVDRFTRDEVNTYSTPFKAMEQPILRGIANMNNIIKIDRTAMYPLTVIRNYLQMPLFALISKTNAGDIGEAFNQIHRVKGDDYKLMLERHIIGADFVSSELSKGPGYLVSGHLDSDIAMKVAKFGMDKILKFYQQPEVLMRAGAFIAARRRFATRAMEETPEAFASLQDAMKHSDVIDKAVEFTNRYTMNYATVPRIVKIGRQLPFVNLFISYTSEITRILKNLTMDAISPTADSAGRMHAITTLSAMAAIPAMLTAMFEGSLSKKDQEDWEKVKTLSPDYSRGRFRLPTSRDKDGRFHYFDITNLLPADSFSQMIKSFSQGDYEAARAANPILSLQNTPLLNMAAEQIAGKDLQTGRTIEGVGRVREILKETLPPILPPGYEGTRLINAFSPNAEGGVGLTNQKTGVQYRPSDVIANYMTGMRFGNVELATVQKSAISNAKQEIALQQAILRDIVNTNTTAEQKQRAQENYKVAEEEIMQKLNAKMQR